MPTSEVPPAPAAPLDLDPPSDQPGFSFGFADPAFAERVSGEWFGYEVSFSAHTGEPQPISVRLESTHTTYAQEPRQSRV